MYQVEIFLVYLHDKGLCKGAFQIEFYERSLVFVGETIYETMVILYPYWNLTSF